MEDRKLHPKLQAVQQLAEGLSQILGHRYELIVHDLSHVESSIVAIHGDVTHRKLGGPATNLLLKMLREYGDDAPNNINYRNALPDGRVLRSSTMFIRDDDGHILGSLCINQDLTDFVVLSKLAEEMTSFQETPQSSQQPEEQFAHDINEVMEDIVNCELELMSKPAAYMQKEEKLAIVDRLESRGIFNVKGAVEYVAERLGVTNFTVYNYLKTVRSPK